MAGEDWTFVLNKIRLLVFEMMGLDWQIRNPSVNSLIASRNFKTIAMCLGFADAAKLHISSPRGQKLTPLEEIKAKKSIPDNVLQKITIAKKNVEPILTSLMKKAITESFIFPDLEGLAKELKRKSGFKND